jgi:hypothetical protein
MMVFNSWWTNYPHRGKNHPTYEELLEQVVDSLAFAWYAWRFQLKEVP